MIEAVSQVLNVIGKRSDYFKIIAGTFKAKGKRLDHIDHFVRIVALGVSDLDLSPFNASSE